MFYGLDENMVAFSKIKGEDLILHRLRKNASFKMKKTCCRLHSFFEKVKQESSWRVKKEKTDLKVKKEENHSLRLFPSKYWADTSNKL